MDLFKLIGRTFQFILNLPMNFYRFFHRLRSQRSLLVRGMLQAKEESKPVSKLGAFFRGVGRVFLYLLLIALVVLFFWFLIWLNHALDLERILGGPWPWLRPFWLPLLVVFAFSSLFLAYRLWLMLGPEKEKVRFPDIDEAWFEARAAMAQAGIDFTAVPLFLVLGKNAGSIDDLFIASKMSFLVRQVPLRSDASVQVYANQQGIFVLTLGNSLLGRQMDEVQKGVEIHDDPVAGVPKYVFDESAPAPEKPKEEKPTTPADFVDSPNYLLDTGESRQAMGSQGKWMQGPRYRLSLLKKSEEVNQVRQRLEYLCRQIVRDRRPYCCLNGVLVLVPFQFLERQEDVGTLSTLIQNDLAILHEQCQVRCPAIALVPDLHLAPGFSDLARGLTEEQRSRLLGRDFPLIPDLKPEELPRMVEAGIRQFGEAFGQLVFRLFKIEDQHSLHKDGNANLYELLGSVKSREQNLARILNRIQDNGDFYLAGCFLAAAGGHPDLQQAFVSGVFRLLIENQNAVAWTKDALDEEEDFQRWTLYGYSALGCFCLFLILMGYWRWQEWGW